MLDLDDQLTDAVALQEKMLPGKTQIEHIQAACPLEVASYYIARDGIGGDIWGIEATAPQRVLLYVADFTGHGLAAALNTARFHSFVHIASQRTDKPASMLRRLNECLHEVLPVEQFATMFCATLDFRAQTMEYASAGAPHSFIADRPQNRLSFWQSQAFHSASCVTPFLKVKRFLLSPAELLLSIRMGLLKRQGLPIRSSHQPP